MLKPKMWFYLAPWGNHMACDSTDAHYEHMVILTNSRWSWERKFLKALFFYQFSSTSQSCLIPCYPIDCSTPDFPVHHQLPELTQTHLHWVGDAIQPSHPLLSSSPPALNLSQHQGFFKWVSSHQVAKVLEFQLQHQSFQWIFRADFLYNWMVWSPFSPKDSQKSFPTPQFKSINSLALSFLYSLTLTSIGDYRKNQSFD